MKYTSELAKGLYLVREACEKYVEMWLDRKWYSMPASAAMHMYHIALTYHLHDGLPPMEAAYQAYKAVREYYPTA